MSTAAVVPAAAPAASKPAFVRFIDKIGGFFIRHEAGIEQAAIDVESLLALTPFGPPYDLVVNAVVGVRRMALASKTAGAEISGPDQMKKVIEMITPGLTQILLSKYVTDNHDTHIANYAQVIFDLLSGPAVGQPPQVSAKAA